MDAELHVINVGKQGITPSLIAQIKLILQKKKQVKVKFLSSYMQEAKKTQTKKEIFKTLAEQCQATIERHVGFVVILKK